MNVCLVKWKNGTISVLTAHDKEDLFRTLDEEGNPFEATISKLPSCFHVTTRVLGGDIVTDFGETQTRRVRKVEFTQAEYSEWCARQN